MNKTYLYQLYKHSKPAVWVVLIFIFTYAFFFFKKIDMLIFPHNSMFAYTTGEQKNQAYTYAVRLNDSLVKTTDFFYWKKDFIESSLATYAKYEEGNRQVYLQEYFQHSGLLPAELQKKLGPEEKSATGFLPWLINYAGYKSGNDTRLSLYRYSFIFTGGKAVLQDSLLIFSQKISRR